MFFFFFIVETATIQIVKASHSNVFILYSKFEN